MANILASDINGWYSKLNTVLQKHGLETISAPAITAKKTSALASQLSALIEKLGWAKTDEYYSHATYVDIPAVEKGTLMVGEVKTSIEATINSIEAVVVCRNIVTNSVGAKKTGNGQAYNSYCYNTKNSTKTTSNSTTSTSTGNSTKATTGNGGNVSCNNSKWSQTTYSNAGGACSYYYSQTSTNGKYSYGQNTVGDGKATTTTTGDGKATSTGNGNAYCGNSGTSGNTTNGYTAPTTTTLIDVSNANAITHNNASDSKII